MLNLPQKTLEKVKRILLRRQKEIATQLKSIDQEDPVLEQTVVESTEPGTDSWLAEAHGRVVALRENLLDLSQKVTHALLRLKQGSYGRCERCGKQIEKGRLDAMPTATLCISCSKKVRNK